MKLLSTTILLLSFSFIFAATTVDPVTEPGVLFEENSNSIDDEMNELNDLNKMIIEKNYTYDELLQNHPEKVNDLNLSADEEGLLDSATDSPLGIGGFWWGFVLGIIGILIVYLSMDEGEDRKEQVKNALIGCLIFAALWTVLWVAVFATSVT